MMNSPKLSFLLFFVLFSMGCMTQLFAATNPNIEKGDYYFDKYSYKKAIKYYAIALKKDENGEAMRKIATSYRLLKDVENAEIWYAKLMDNSARQSLDIYYYAEMLKSNGKYNDYLIWIRRYQKSAKEDSRVTKALENQNYIKGLLEDKNVFEIKDSISFNSKFSDISPAYYKDTNQVVFSSNRYKFKLFGPKDNWNDGNFYDFYATKLDSTGEFLEPISYRDFNTKYHDVGITFNTEGNEVYFGRTYYYDKELQRSSKGDLNLSLFTSKLEDDTWTEVKKLPFINKEYTIEHPTLSENERYLFFASDMKGGKGGYDIYVMERLGDKKWSKPVNLGDEINTEGNEVFPFIHPSGRLYFSSDGLPGLGGLDIFEASIDFEDEYKVSKLKNLGYPINEMKDDFSLIMNRKQTGGYFSSNRPGGLGDDDIYAFDYHKPEFDSYTFEGLVVKGQSDTIIPFASVVIKDKYGVLIDSVIADVEGKFTSEAEVFGSYYFFGSQKGYTPNSAQVVINSNNEKAYYPVKISLDTIIGPDSAAIVQEKFQEYKEHIKEKMDTLTNLAEAKLVDGFKLKSRDKKFIYDEEREVAVYLDSLSYLIEENDKHKYIVDNDSINYEAYTKYNEGTNHEVEELNKVFFAKEVVDSDEQADELNKKAKKEGGELTQKEIEKINDKYHKDSTGMWRDKDDKKVLNPLLFKDVELLSSIEDVVIVDDHTIIPPIYFEYADHEVKKHAHKSLNSILKFMKANEDVMLEIRSHTDCRGSDMYNIRLSERRAQNASFYIINKGIFLGRIRAKGLGESMLLNNCACEDEMTEKNGCTEAHHRENRRTEFSFFKIDLVVSKESAIREKE